MPSKNTVLSVPVQVNTEIFRDFAAFDVWTRQKRWQRPLVFALILLAGAVICFSQVGKREGAVLLGSVLTLVGLGLPAVYVTMFFQSVNRQAKVCACAPPAPRTRKPRRWPTPGPRYTAPGAPPGPSTCM